MESRLYLVLFLTLTFLAVSVLPKKADPKEKPAWAKKDIRDFDDADMERLLDQWEVKAVTNCRLFRQCPLSTVSSGND